MADTTATAVVSGESSLEVVRARSAAARKAAVTAAERRAKGRELRDVVPRASHADWTPSGDRTDPVALLEAQNVDRVADLVPIRYGRMVASPFAFLRGSAAVMSADLAGTPTTGVSVQACGDAHLMNFGVFGTQERNLVFGMNDFDETLPGPWEWDVKRLAASFVVAGREGGVSESRSVDAAKAAVRSYRMRLAEYAEMGGIQTWYANIDVAALLPVLSPDVRKRAEAIAAKARTRTNIQVLEKTTELIDGDFRIVESPPLVVRDRGPETSDGQSVTVVLQRWLDGYRASLANDRRRLLDRYRVVDAVRKVVGVGSVGTRCYVVLLRGETDRDVLFLQVKEAAASVLEPYVAPGRFAYHGRRVVQGQRLIQPAPDIFLGSGRLTDRRGRVLDYYVRQLRDMKGSVTFEPGNVRPGGLIEYGGVCGWALALAHARSGDAATISGYLGKSDIFDDAVARFAVTYADQTERDHAALVEAVRTGRVVAEHDV
ncbi:MAG: DUF2252 domain-containing protein [Chloroflexota bacterium]|jgi:uncharacterized protein (DUF2252 family)|nr:DUF2252 domain-containing protein [Chloroflexota bacterium]